MNSSEELFDIVDDHDQVIGQSPRAEVHARRLKHRAIHVLLFNSRKELFIQKRAATKDSHPLRYDSSASGHVNSGEDYDTCALRELKEELGLELPASAFQRLFKLYACAETGWEFVWVYRVHGDYRPVINQQEIESGKYWALPAVHDLVEKHPESCAPAFCRIIREVRVRGLLPPS